MVQRDGELSQPGIRPRVHMLRNGFVGAVELDSGRNVRKAAGMGCCLEVWRGVGNHKHNKLNRCLSIRFESFVGFYIFFVARSLQRCLIPLSFIE